MNANIPLLIFNVSQMLSTQIASDSPFINANDLNSENGTKSKENLNEEASHRKDGRATMANILWFSSYALVSTLFSILALSLAIDAEKKVYIVYMGAKQENELAAVNQHSSILQEVLQDGLVEDSLVYNYKRSFNGFAAKLTEEESRKIAGREGVVSVFPSINYQLHTTRSWNFLGLSKSIKRVPTVESDLIVGVLDTGLWPESKSFNDHGLGPPPKKWKGTCQTKNFTCNKKVIGARVYPNTGSSSPRDDEGHGSHTASTVAGRTVHGASLYGIAEGDARGGVPSAKIAVYKVCSTNGCNAVDILAGFDDAIADGVDVISVSLGPPAAIPFPEDPIAVGSFHAMANGILTSNSAGNSGPELGSVSSVAPWILTVAATSIDRRIINKLILGNGKTFVGNAVNTFSLNGTRFPLISGGDARSPPCEKGNLWYFRSCFDGCLDPKLVKGKILYCNGLEDGTDAHDLGALGLVTLSPLSDTASDYPLPATSLSLHGLQGVESYIKKTRKPQANILKSESAIDKKAPTVVSFSSRGPNTITSKILKPDISAPGVNILAAWSPVAHLSGLPDDKRSTKYHIVSGTSMACPHATAAAAYVKSFHPNWSPSAIKSALITTATPLKRTRNKEGEFAYGAGNINPVKARNPGLVFDASKKDYIQFLCHIGYSTKQVRQISGDNSSCPEERTGSENDINYPSLTINAGNSSNFNLNFSRTVTNVGKPNSNYTVRIEPKNSKSITVHPSPSFLHFTRLNQKKDFRLRISVSVVPKGEILSYSVIWSDGEHEVRFPVVIYSLG
ncbi:subtilisin-like protease SBT4.3 [Aristolochia californica]|uniref:subtilisin-like protease SBT4.3 n=1 Tax=Aristolochia californica TaxID=171875 RepID=UPI0035DCF0F1